MSERAPVALVANPSADVYGSDLQLLESVQALIEDGFRVVVALTTDGPLVRLLADRGADVIVEPFAILRRSEASAGGIARLAVAGLRSIRSLRRLIRRVNPDVLYVNTVTIPWWLVAGRLTRTPSVCHVHEAETTDGRLVRFALNAPLIFANRLIAISNASLDALRTSAPGLARKTTLIYNGVTEPAVEPEPEPSPAAGQPYRVAVVARLSPRKAPNVALDAVGLLRERGRNVEIDICGTPFDGYEWFEDELRERARQPDLVGGVQFSGYVSPIWPALERANLIAAPSLREPFGNAVVEAQLAMRPVVAAAALGHLETVSDGVTGLLVPPNDAAAMADAIERLIDDPDLSAQLAAESRTVAVERFSLSRYRREISKLVRSLQR